MTDVEENLLSHEKGSVSIMHMNNDTIHHNLAAAHEQLLVGERKKVTGGFVHKHREPKKAGLRRLRPEWFNVLIKYHLFVLNLRQKMIHFS